MGRKVAMLWHASFSIGAGVLYFFFVLPRWPELMGDTAHSLGTGLRITAGALFGLAALPVVFTLLRTRKPELGTPALALSIRTWSIVAHVLAGVLIIGTAISEIWLSLDSVGQWLFGIYGAAAAIAVLGFFAFYLSFVAELPPPPPKPIKVKEPKQRRRRKKGGEGDDVDETDEAEDAEAEDVDEADEADEAEEADEASDGEESVESEEAEQTEEAEVAEEAEAAEAAEETAEPEAQGEDATAHGGLRNRRPTGKTSHRRRRVRRGVTVEE
ncbi:hypothetical protein NJB1907f44_39630 [Mycobacterium marinum]|uniref:hypothetical protein n=1 Tax=Mycobacterium marinum TaxID=1781 RepID=UPI000E3C8552|nr:hypothetical protein [Mycobacterium marinum]RFZ46148.1 prolipoprotein diacylglyceryl transferase [Mycobacterium marinum]GJO07182.1 hypothetical protein NJB1808e29_37430 [Mycobacterium marinum]GJO12538.1 hypothetical protein NJB1907E90_34600 [Mycobacterium marinum]GJO20808.1 hypothetical protein NJB1907f22_01030 [Mycobacterium marinum]GJO28686.1 hypothetical protein NJB1907E11_47060 [Mycobacterium marinum]